MVYYLKIYTYSSNLKIKDTRNTRPTHTHTPTSLHRYEIIRKRERERGWRECVLCALRVKQRDNFKFIVEKSSRLKTTLLFQLKSYFLPENTPHF